MPAPAPKFKTGDLIYLSQSASLGKLESYRVSSGFLKFSEWIYQIDIIEKPPAEATVADRVDLKNPTQLFFPEKELLVFCEAINKVIFNFKQRILRLEGRLANCTVKEEPELGRPRFEVGERVFIRASANIGFIESYDVDRVHFTPSRQQFAYEINLARFPVQGNIGDRRPSDPGAQLFFNESEFVSECEAFDIAVNKLRKELKQAEIKAEACNGTS